LIFGRTRKDRRRDLETIVEEALRSRRRYREHASRAVEGAG
jgi:hypothetical protein